MVVQLAAPPKIRLITGQELLALGDIGPCELIEGRIIPMSPVGNWHGGVEVNIAAELRTFVRAHKLGRVQGGEVGVYTRRNPDTVRGADALFISHERYAGQTSDGYLEVAPDLIVEVLSPNDRPKQLKDKLQEYFEIGVRLVWVVDPRRRRVSAYRSLDDVRHFGENDLLPGDNVLPGFAVQVAELLDE
jgi:Uma2 family endonuclease